MAKVQFRTRRGRKVSFTTRPKSKQGRKKPLSATARYVRKHIGAHLRRGKSPTTALEATVKDYKKSKKRK